MFVRCTYVISKTKGRYNVVILFFGVLHVCFTWSFLNTVRTPALFRHILRRLVCRYIMSIQTHLRLMFKQLWSIWACYANSFHIQSTSLAYLQRSVRNIPCVGGGVCSVDIAKRICYFHQKYMSIKTYCGENMHSTSKHKCSLRP